jgi:acetyl esterase
VQTMRFDLRRQPEFQLSFASRMRIGAQRSLLRWLGRHEGICQRLLKRKRAEVERGLDPDTALILELAEITRQATLGRGDAPHERLMMKESIAVAEQLVDENLTITPRTIAGIPARLYEPSDLSRPSPGLLFVHGGGWVTGDLDTHDAWCRRLAVVGRMRVLAIEPRLAPEHPFPAPVDDTVLAFRQLAKEARSYGMDVTRLGVGGDSAGGNLSAVVGLETRKDAVRPVVTALLYPAVDATLSHPSIRNNGKGFLLTEESIEWYLNHYLGKSRPELVKNPRVSPLHESDVSGAPRALVVVAGFDPLVDEGVAYAEKLKKAGTTVDLVRYDALIHGFLLMTALSPAARTAADETAKRIGELLRA